MHIDVYSGILTERPAAWFKALLVGLLTMPESRLHKILHPTEPKADAPGDMDGG